MGSKVIGCDLGVRFPPNFQRPVAAKPYVGSEKSFTGAKLIRNSSISIIMPSMMVLGLRRTPRGGGAKVL